MTPRKHDAALERRLKSAWFDVEVTNEALYERFGLSHNTMGQYVKKFGSRPSQSFGPSRARAKVQEARS